MSDLTVLKITKPNGQIHFAPASSIRSHQDIEGVKPPAQRNRLELITEEEKVRLESTPKGGKAGDLLWDKSSVQVSGDMVVQANNIILKQNEVISEKDRKIAELEAKLADNEKPGAPTEPEAKTKTGK